MNKVVLVLGGLLVIASFIAFTQKPACDCGTDKSVVDASSDEVYQVSTFNALLEGIYDGDTSIAELARHGGFGIGTYNALDGELVALDGSFYQVKDTGEVEEVSGAIETPFASVTFFKEDNTFLLNDSVNYSVMQASVDGLVPTKNIPYAIKVSGRFGYMKTRAPHKQNKPYPGLVDALADQPVFEFSDITGTLVGYRLPDYVNGINVPGYHLHFIDSKKASGGHVLDFRIDKPSINVDYKYGVEVTLPDAEEFNKVELAGNRSEEIEKTEK